MKSITVTETTPPTTQLRTHTQCPLIGTPIRRSSASSAPSCFTPSPYNYIHNQQPSSTPVKVVLGSQPLRPLPQLRSLCACLFSLPKTAELLAECMENRPIFTETGKQSFCEAVQRFMDCSSSCTVDAAQIQSHAMMNFYNLVTNTENRPPTTLTAFGLPPNISEQQEKLLRLVDQLLTLHSDLHPSSLQIPTHAWAVAFVTCLLDEIVTTGGLTAVLAESNNHVRFHLILACLKNLLAPSPQHLENANDTLLASVRLLAVVLPEGMKVPLQVVQTVVRPALSQLCSGTNMSLSFATGLLNVIQLIPYLFNNTFLTKVLSILKSLTALDQELLDKYLIAGAMVDYFAALCTTLDCSEYVRPLCEVAIAFKLRDEIVLPLAKLLALLPQNAATVLSEPDMRGLLIRISTISPRGSVMTAYRSLHSYFSASEDSQTGFSDFFMNSSFSDVQLVVGHLRVPAHKVVLTRCAFFFSLFSSGFSETSQEEITLRECEPQAFLAALRHIYGLPVETNLIDLEMLFRVLQTADFLALNDLKAQCETSLAQKLLTTNPTSIPEILPQLTGLEDWASSELLQVLRDRLLKARTFLATMPAISLVRTVLCKSSLAR